MVQSHIEDILENLISYTEQVEEGQTISNVIIESQSSVNCIPLVSSSDGKTLAFCPGFLELVCIRTQEVLQLFYQPATKHVIQCRLKVVASQTLCH